MWLLKVIFSKIKPNYNAGNSGIRQPKLKAVKQYEIDLHNGENGRPMSYKSGRKALSTQKERLLQSSKLTSNIPKRQVGMLSSQKSREKFGSKKNVYNSHSKSNLKRPFTSATKRKSLANQNTGLEASKTYLNEDLRRADHKNMLGSTHSPDIMRNKAMLMQNKSMGNGDNNNAQIPYDSTYMSIERNFAHKKEAEDMDEDTPTSSTPGGSHHYIRSTVTPCRFPAKSQSKIFRVDPEAFIQPNSDESSSLIVNLEDIVKEEHVIFNIQNNITK
jgi:hypothetical protein